MSVHPRGDCLQNNTTTVVAPSPFVYFLYITEEHTAIRAKPGQTPKSNIGPGFALFASHQKLYMSHDMRFPSMWYVRPAMAQTSLRIRAV